jgi:hypothetical protein
MICTIVSNRMPYYDIMQVFLLKKVTEKKVGSQKKLNVSYYTNEYLIFIITIYWWTKTPFSLNKAHFSP